MGQEASSLMRYGSPKERAIELSMAIRGQRDRLGVILAELEHRRRELFDIPLQVKRNAVPLVLLAAALGGILATTLSMRARRIRKERRLVARFHRARRAIGRAIQDPDRVAAPPPDMGKKLIIAIASATATTLVTVVVKRIVEEVIVPPAQRGARELRAAALPAKRTTPREVGRGVEGRI